MIDYIFRKQIVIYGEDQSQKAYCYLSSITKIESTTYNIYIDPNPGILFYGKLNKRGFKLEFNNNPTLTLKSFSKLKKRLIIEGYLNAECLVLNLFFPLSRYIFFFLFFSLIGMIYLSIEALTPQQIGLVITPFYVILLVFTSMFLIFGADMFYVYLNYKFILKKLIMAAE